MAQKNYDILVLSCHILYNNSYHETFTEIKIEHQHGYKL